MNNNLSFGQIEQFLSDEAFVLATIQQIHKDLAGLVTLNPNFSLDFTGDVYSQLSTHLKDLMNGLNDRELQQFVYRVDIKEADYLNAISANDDFEKLAFLIIQREAQKVYFKLKYS